MFFKEKKKDLINDLIMETLNESIRLLGGNPKLGLVYLHIANGLYIGDFDMKRESELNRTLFLYVDKYMFRE